MGYQYERGLAAAQYNSRFHSNFSISLRHWEGTGSAEASSENLGPMLPAYKEAE